MSFLNKLNNLIEKSINYYELQLLAYLCSIEMMFTVFCICYFFINPGGGIIYMMFWELLYIIYFLIIFVFLILHFINKTTINIHIQEGHNFTTFYLRFYKINILINLLYCTFVCLSTLLFIYGLLFS